MTNKMYWVFIFLVFFSSGLIADDLVDTYLKNAGNHYIVKDYEKAYSYINFVLKFYSGGELPTEAEVLAEKIYFDYLAESKNQSDYETIDAVKLNLLDYPKISSNRISVMIADAEIQQTAEIQAAAEKAAKEEAARIAEAKRIEDARLEEERRKREDAIKAEERRLAVEKEKREEAIRLEELRIKAEQQAREDAIRAEELAAEKEQKEREDELALLALKLEEQKLKLEEQMQEENLRVSEAMQKVDEEIKKANLRLEEEKAQTAASNRIEDLTREDEQKRKEETLRLEELQLERERIELETAAKAQELKERLEIEAKAREELSKVIVTTLAASEQNNKANTRFSIIIIVFIALVGFFILAGFGLMIFLFIKRSQQQQMEFESVMFNTKTGPRETRFLPMSTGASLIDDSELIENGQPMRQLPSPVGIDKDKIEAIMPKCYSYAKEIDNVTKRKNGARNVAELVYKISEYSGYSNEDCMLHFAVGLVYDIGFLTIDPTVLAKDTIAEEEFILLKNHTNLGLNMIHFIDKEMLPVFSDGVLKHHENLDGSGYPDGLTSDEIPYIARVLRVVDSYISLISTRNYRAIMHKEAAIEELHNKSHEYDVEIINILESLV